MAGSLVWDGKILHHSSPILHHSCLRSASLRSGTHGVGLEIRGEGFSHPILVTPPWFSQCLLGPKQRLSPPVSKELWGRKTRVLGHGSSRTIHFLDPCQKLPWLRPKKGPISLVSSGLFGKSTISELPKLITDLVHTARSALRCTCTETALTMYTATLTERARSKSWRNLSLVALSTYAST